MLSVVSNLGHITRHSDGPFCTRTSWPIEQNMSGQFQHNVRGHQVEVGNSSRASLTSVGVAFDFISARWQPICEPISTLYSL